MTRLEFERRRRGWNQTTLAFHADTTQAEISRVETRRLVPTDAYLERLAWVLGVEPANLLDEITPQAHGEIARAS